MNLLQKLFNRDKAGNELRTGGMEEFMNLIRVYFQASIANKVGITNLNMLPDLRVFKQTLKVPTVNNRLGLNEKKPLPQDARRNLRLKGRLLQRN